MPLSVTGSAGTVGLQERIYRPLIDALARNDYTPKTVTELASDPTLKDVAFDQLVMALVVLVGTGSAQPAQKTTKQSRARCKGLNLELCRQARSSAEIPFLASPVTGSGIGIARFHQLFLLAEMEGGKTPVEQAEFTWQVLSSLGQGLIKNGQVLPTREANLAELTGYASHFAATKRPLYEALGII